MSQSAYRSPGSRPRRFPWGLLVAAFILVPLVEIYVIIQVGQVIGAWWTILLLIADSVFGSWLVRHEGRRAWQALTTAIQSGRMPSRELADGALILVGGTLMVSPGFVTDAVGIWMILPFTRPLPRRILTRMVTRRFLDRGGRGGGSTGSPPAGHGPVVQGEVVDE